MKPNLKISAILLATLFAACTQEPDYPTPVVREDVVTFISSEEGTGTDFDLWDVSGDCISLHSEQVFSNAPERGDRVLLRYSYQLADADTRPLEVEIEDCFGLIYSPIEVMTAEEIAALPGAAATVISRWDTGPYINLQILADYSGESRGIGLVADKSTLADEEVKCYLYHTGSVGPDYIQRRTIASFHTGNLDPDGRFKFSITPLK